MENELFLRPESSLPKSCWRVVCGGGESFCDRHHERRWTGSRGGEEVEETELKDMWRVSTNGERDDAVSILGRQDVMNELSC